MDKNEFENSFQALTGSTPMSWQSRLYRQWIEDGDKSEIKPIVDLPTGMGKTMVMAIWLLARENNPKLGRRLIYVVDRRTVVDQATDLAEEFAYLLALPDPREDEQVAKRNLKLVERKQKYAQQLLDLRQKLKLGNDRLAISTLRGQLADNRQWSRDPTKPAIIIGTVDLIGSALLFSGYRSSYKRRPLEAGLLGQDSLLVLDEAHLSKPFEKLICAIDSEGSFQKGRNGKVHGLPMRVIRMSATSGNSANVKPFTLEFDGNGDLTGEDANDQTIVDRFTAKKALTITEGIDPKKINDKMAKSAIELVEDKSIKGKGIVVFVRKPEQARAIAEIIRNHESTKAKPGPYAQAVEVLTGTMRGLERDELVKKPILQRFLNGNEKPGDNQEPVFLISTSAGEVGFDLNADHMVCDATTIDSLIQRLGRVNRRGGEDRHATVILVREQAKKKDGKPVELKGLDLAIANTTELLNGIKGNEKNEKDVSPKNIAALKNSPEWNARDEHGTSKYERACSPEPTTVDLTDILLDAWSMTSIIELMPGRPEVGPWLRGIDDEQAQTTVAWRAEIELFQHVPTPEKSLQAIFAKHPIRPHESLTVNTGHLLEFLKQIPKLKDRPNGLMTVRAAVRLPRGRVICRTLQQLVDDPSILYADSTLVLPAKFGGLDNSGTLDAESIPKTRKDGDAEPDSLDVADADGYEQGDEARSRLRIVIERTEAGWMALPLPGGPNIPADVQLAPPYEKTTPLFDAFKKAKFRVRLREDIEFDEEGDAVRCIVCLAPAPKKKGNENQFLTDHVAAVETEAKRIADALSLIEHDPIRIALLFAAKWHDEGKKARVWQVFANNADPDGVPLGKIAQARDPKSLKHYRHEFGSLVRIHHQDRFEKINCTLPNDKNTRDLALHLIATHHGDSRPHFPIALYDPIKDGERDALHADSIRRFARLQKEYGWWYLAWLENLLRCADQLASADEEVTEIDELEEGAE